jgi:hypothetical protein
MIVVNVGDTSINSNVLQRKLQSEENGHKIGKKDFLISVAGINYATTYDYILDPDYFETVFTEVTVER